MAKLTLGLPKGSLEEATFEILKKAGYAVQSGARSYNLTVDDPEISARLIRPQDMSRYVEKGIVDAGITGKDWVRENGSEVVAVAELNYSKRQLSSVRWVLAVPADSPIQSAKDLQGKRIATELVNVTHAYLAKHGVTAHVEFSHGATEAKAPDLVDAIVDVTETGSTLKAHGLRIVDTVMESITQLIANPRAWQDGWKRQKIENIAMLCHGAIRARLKVGLKMNVPKDALDRVVKMLPALREPTVSPLAGGGWFAIETVLDETVARELEPELKRAGAEGLIEYPLNKVIL